MKTIKIVIALLMFACTVSFAQTAPSTFSQSVNLREGMNTIKLEKDKGNLIIMVRDNKIFSLTFQATTGKITKLKTSDNGQTSGGTNCPNGYSCWEDEEQMMSICVCKSGGGQHNDFVTNESFS